MKAAIIGGVLLIVVILLAIIVLPRDDRPDLPVVYQNDPQNKGPVSIQNVAEKPSVNPVGDGAVKPNDAAASSPEPDAGSHDAALQRALDSMRDSLASEDPRTPEMSRPWEREKPTAEEMADPTLYEAYELRQTKRLAAIYAGVSQEIPAIRDKINAAKLSGSQTDDEIQEAEEALAKMESLSEMLRLNYPDVTEDSADIQEALEATSAQDAGQ